MTQQDSLTPMSRMLVGKPLQGASYTQSFHPTTASTNSYQTEMAQYAKGGELAVTT